MFKGISNIQKRVITAIVLMVSITGVIRSGDKESNCPPGNISMLFTTLDCLEGNYFCILYVYGNPTPVGSGYLSYPGSIKYIASGNFCRGTYRWEVTGPVNFATCYVWYDPYVNNDLIITTGCDGCTVDIPNN